MTSASAFSASSELSPTAKLSATGVSIWLDDLSRERINSGNLAQLIAERNVVGVTTNPTIFANALTSGTAYATDLAKLASVGASAEHAVVELTTDDVRHACDLFHEVWLHSEGRDGRVSIEVSPGLAHDASATIVQAKELWERVARPNVLIKIPATSEGLIAMRAVLAAGISVNVTLIFSVEQYRQVIEAYLDGIEAASVAGHDISTIHSVASFFISRVDTEVDARLTDIGTPEALELRSRAGLANARLAYELFLEAFGSARAMALLELGGNLQRPLWASTGVKSPQLPDTTYVTELVAAHVVNTMPEATLNALSDHGVISGDTITPNFAQAHRVFGALKAVGIDFDDVATTLERDGIFKFAESWNDLLERTAHTLDESSTL